VLWKQFLARRQAGSGKAGKGGRTARKVRRSNAG